MSSDEFDDSDGTGDVLLACFLLTTGALSYDTDLDFFLETCLLGDNFTRSGDNLGLR